ncbi:DinB superfamily protein [Granulicella rosea]|uniref:DinB superfamily protein n=1 Tax=Granulicella rosea TaxID=474952 RepID=A0A239M8N8_9BACT|nr:DinB family protein [Granulicella rosea]SNT38542.1 DinB superfamily protein [Granulicella rosea]
MELNPYVKFLGDRDAVEVIGHTCAQLVKLMEKMPEAQLALAPPTARWSAREIVAHLADCELVFAFRLRQTLAEEAPIIQPFDQDRWAARYAPCDAASAMRLFESLRTWNLLLLDTLKPADWDRPTTHPERGAMTFRTIVETIAGHDLNHLGQLERLIG